MKIGFIGLGTMGRHMAANLQKAGHDVVVHDMRQAAAESHLANGARWANSAAEAAQGVHVMDAPVSGGPNGAEKGTLQVMCGGDEDVYNRVRPALLGIGDKVSYVGAIGAGAIAKLCHNTMSYCANLAMAEIFTLGVKAGLEPEKLLECLQGGAYGQNNMLKHRVPNLIFKGAWEPAGFYMALARKDVGLATELAREYNVPMNVASLAEQALIEGLARGWDSLDSSAIWMLQEERAGVKVRTEEKE